ncbi:MAG TPA: hypothetical protein V6C89_12375 [Drouetiella sp.]
MDQDKNPLEAESPAPLLPDADMAASVATSFSPYKCFSSKQWWSNALLLSFLFAKHCVAPAGLYLASLAIFLVPSIFVVATFKKTVDISQLVQAMIVYVVTLIVAVPMLFWCFGAWLVRLTAFSAAFASFSRAELIENKVQSSRVQEVQRDALDHVKRQKVFLAKFWSTLTIFLSIPCALFLISMLVLSCTSPAVLGTSALKLPVAAMVATDIVCLISGLSTTIVSFVGVSVSSVTDNEPVKQAKKAVALSARGILPLTVITASCLFASVLITCPQELVHGGRVTTPGVVSVSWLSVVQEVWRAVSSTVIWTLTIAPICEFLRGKQISNG